MAPAAEGLARILEHVSVLPLGTALVANATAQVNRSAERVKGLLVRQVTAAVRWEESIRLLRTLGCEATAEIGPGRVLQGLQKRIEPTFPCTSVSDGATLVTLKRTLL